jgi:hypothetical protein
VFEKRVLRRIFGPKRDEVTRGWINLHNEKLHNLYPSPSTIRMIQSSTMRWAGHITGIDEVECMWDIGGEMRRKDINRKTKK